MTYESAPKISVVVPVFNMERYLRAALDSALAQTLREIEIICVDDGSTDESPAILAEYAARDPRVRVITQENSGVGPARNAGIRAARGEFVAFLDPDDLLPDASVYEALYFYAKENRVRVCGGGVCSLANDGKRYFPNASWGANVDQAFPREGFMRFADWQFDYGFYRYIFERALLLDDEIFFPPYIRYQDPPFCARALEAAGEFYALRRTTYVFRDWHTPDYTDRRRVCDQLRGIRDLLKFSRERGYAKLHWLQIHRLFEEFKPHVLDAARREKEEMGGGHFSGAFPSGDQSVIALLKEIDAVVSFPLAWQYKFDYPFRAFREEFEIQDCFPPVPDAPFPQDTVDCAFITDDGYVNMTAVAINSIRRSRAPETKVRIHIVAAALSEYSEKVFKLFEEKDFSVEIIRVEKAVLDKLATLHKAKERSYCMATPAALLKFSLPELLPDLNRVLYLDGDVLVRRDLGELFRTPLGENYAAAVTDVGCLTGTNLRKQKLGKWLFNSGMMLLNLSLQRKHEMPRTLTEAKARSKDHSLMDQTIFNETFAGRATLLPPEYNFLPVWYYLNKYRIDTDECRERCKNFYGIEIKDGSEILERSFCIIHFAGTLKPWDTPDLPFATEWNELSNEAFSVWLSALRNNHLSFTPNVSVIVPVYNTEPYLRECLDSICGQTLRNIEIICVNDGSTDGSLSILEEYAARDPRVRVFSQENFGQGHARNVGLDLARGEYVYFMDSDDCLPFSALQKEYASAKAADLDVLLFEGESMYESKELEERFPVYKTLYLRKGDYPGVLSGQQAAVSLKKNRAAFVSPCCFISKREFLSQNELRFPEGYFYEDNVFFFALLKAAERVSVVHEKLFVRRVREGSTMTKPVGFRNFLGYAHVVAELEKLAREGADEEFKKVLFDTSAWMSRAIAGYYETFFPEDRARSRELLAGALKDSAWLDSVRERIAGIDAEKKEEIRVDSRESDAGKKEEPCVDSREAAGEAPESGDGNAASPEEKKIYPAFLVRLGAAFILNKAARKRWRERHMDLTPKDGIDLNAHPELRRDGALKRFAVRAASLFIFSKKKRKAFRAKHLNLRPRDGVDVRALSSRELARLREAKRSRSTLWRVFDALVPATRGKIAHTERHLRRAAEEQTRILVDELRRMHDENRRTLGAVRAELKIVRERADALSRELAASKTELKDRTLATERALRAELSATREALTLKTLAAKHAALDAESNLQARLGEVLESLNAARSEFAQAAAETVRAVNARADALCASAEATEMRHAETSSRLARLEEQGEAAQSAMSEIPGKLSALSELVPATERALRRECASVAAAVSSASAETENRLESLARSAEETRERLRAYTDYRLLADALPGFIEKLRERNPLAREELTDELFASSVEASCVADCEQRFSDRIRAAFSDRTPAYYERVPAEARERELKLWFKLRTGRDLDLKHPKTFNEKIQWLKLYDVSPLKTRLADKFEVREWIREKIGEKYLTPLIGVYDTFDEIDFDRLPDKFVLKTTHGSGYNIVVKDKSRFDKADAKKKFDDWLSRKFEYQAGFEMHYAGMKPRIIAEEFLDIDESGTYEWQAFCFNGEAKFFLVIVGGAHDSTPGKRFYYSPKWEKLPFTSLARELPEGAIPCPDNFAELAECVKKLCDGFLHVRVDFYRLRDGSWKFGEMTFSTASGLWTVYPEEYDRVVGDMLTLPAEENSEK